MSALPWIITGLPLAVGLVLLLSALRGRAEDAAGPVGIATAGVTLILSLWATVTRPESTFRWLESISLSLSVDGLAVAMLLTLSVIMLAIVFVVDRELPAGKGRARCMGWLLILLAASLAASMATSLLLLLIAWELIALAVWPLIGFAWQDGRQVRTGIHAYLFLRAGDLGLYLAAVAAMAGAGSFEIAAAANMDTPWIHLAAGGLILSAAIKSAQLPFSIWMGEIFNRRRNISGALVVALMVIGGGYLLARTYPILAQTGWALPAVAWIGGITALVLGLVALAQHDLQQALAASSASQKGFILLAVGVGTLPGAVAYIVAHAAFKALLFVGAAIYLRRAGTTALWSMTRMRTLAPRATLLFSLGALALLGFPPLSGWVVKDEVLAAAHAASPLLYALGMAAALVTALYGSRLFWLVRESSDFASEPQAERAQDAAGLSLAAMLLLAMATLVTSALILSPVRAWWSDLIGGPVGPRPDLWSLAMTGLLAAGALLLTGYWRRVGRLEPLAAPGLPLAMMAWLQRWLGLGRGVRALSFVVIRAGHTLARIDDRGPATLIDMIGWGARRTSRTLAGFDDRGPGAFVDHLARWGANTSRRAAHFDNRTIDGIVEEISARIGALGRQARRLQTGLLHQYYAQAVAVLVVFVVIFWLMR
jgi:NADH-quinone oxidoreductase subunit L